MAIQEVVVYGAAAALILIGYFMITSSGERKVLSNDKFQEFPLIKKQQVTHNSALFTFGLPRATDVLGLPIGQHIQIASEINGKAVVRSYTPTSLDEDSKGQFDLLIKVYPNGNVSRYVDDLKIGETIKVKGPKGFFTYTPNMVTKFGMIAGGTGITPMYQIIKAICNNPEDHTEVFLLYGNVSEEDILLKDELDELSSKNDNIHVFHVLNKPPEGWTQGVGFISKELVTEKLPDASDDTQLLLCGPPPMVSALKRAAVELGFKKAKPISKLGDQVFVF
ncbi:DEKNAAC103088 [Brettanomyces naardenensis]|uniref:NADH-cytochrome b5 reductase n=1 Tax=Brettanomyces naardenensis TaxID=13370 RepID=A0A448YMF2_BRENA|nr:DEKNAAC103088 [Brettanomyces naardenensis]